jgi:two-component system NarL family sensor kinase
VQDLAGLGFSLSAAAARENSPQLREAASQTRNTMRKLRSVLVDIYPPSLQRAGLQAAIGDLTSALAAQGTQVDVDVPASTALGQAKEALIFRTVQEGLRNAAKHAGAQHVEVRVDVGRQTATAVVSDDGRGFDPALSGNGNDESHMGLKLLSDLAEEAGGRLWVESAAGQGTQVRLEVPVA